jgi:hypothetical protein
MHADTRVLPLALRLDGGDAAHGRG